jgi:membrane protein implicated in regulation of membrane protease activity
MDGFLDLTLIEQIYWTAAIAGTLLLGILLVMTLLGGDIADPGDTDATIAADTGIDFQFLSFKNLVGFFTIFGWSGLACLDSGMSTGLTVLISVVCGALMMLVMASLFYYLSRMQSSGTLKYRNAVGQIGEVYLTIGEKRSSIGKISIVVQGRLWELDAITDENSPLVRGNIIKVKEVTDNGIFIVEKLKQE